MKFPELFNTLIEQSTTKIEVTFMCSLEITWFSTVKHSSILTVRHSSILYVSEYLCTTYPWKAQLHPYELHVFCNSMCQQKQAQNYSCESMFSTKIFIKLRITIHSMSSITCTYVTGFMETIPNRTLEVMR